MPVRGRAGADGVVAVVVAATVLNDAALPTLAALTVSGPVSAATAPAGMAAREPALWSWRTWKQSGTIDAS